MHHSKEWKDLENWSYFHHFWHFYNSSATLPRWFYTLRIIITCLQTFPILFGIPLVLHSASNEIFIACEYLSNLFVYFSFSSVSVTIGFLLVFDIFTIAVTSIAYFSDKIIFNKIYSLLIHFVLEILSPIMFNLAGAILQKEVSNLVLKIDPTPNYFFLISSLLSTIIFFIFFTICSYSHSNTVYFTNFYFESWSSWDIYFKTVIPTFILLFLPLNHKFEKIGFYVEDSLIFIYALISIVSDSRIPFLNMVVNMSFLIVDFVFFFLAIFHVFPFIFTNFDDSVNTAIVVILLVVSVPCAELVYNMQSKRLNTILLKASKAKKNMSDDDDDDNDPNYLESSSSSSAINLSDMDVSVNLSNIYPFSTQLADDRKAVLILRHLIMNKVQSIEFAKFLFNNSKKINIWFASVRFLILRKVITPEDSFRILNIDMSKISFHSKQAFCDAQYEAVGLKVSQESAAVFLEDLDVQQKSIEKILLCICASIVPKEKEATRDFIQQYSRACNEYELSSLIFMAHSPNSAALAHRLAQYYLKLRGDFIQGQLWQQKEDTLNAESENRGAVGLSQTTAVAVSSSTRASDTITMNRLKSQTVVQRIKSKSVIATSAIFFVLLIIMIFMAFYLFEDTDTQFVLSPIVPISMVRIASYSITTLSAQMNYSMQIYKDCNPQYAPEIDEMNKTITWPSLSTVALLSTLMQNISHCISSLNRDVKGASEAISIWANPETSFREAKSLQFQIVLLNTFTSLLTPGKCDENSYENLDTFVSITESLIFPMQKIHAAMLIYCNTVFASFMRKYIIYCSCFVAAECILIIFIIAFSTYYSKFERRNFWKVFREIENHDLDEFKNTLKPTPMPTNEVLQLQQEGLAPIAIDGEMQNNENTKILNPIGDEENSIGQISSNNSNENENNNFNENDDDLISYIVSKYRIPKAHPHHLAAFVLYSIFVILMTALVFYIILIPYNKIKNRFYENNYDLENMDYIAQRLYLTASLTPAVFLDKDRYIFEWNQAIGLSDFQDTSLIPGNAGYLKKLIEYNQHMNILVEKFILSDYKDHVLVHDIIELAFKNASEIAYDRTTNGYDNTNNNLEFFVGISHLKTACFIVLIILYSVVFVLRTYAYSLEFNSMKSILMLLPSPYSSTIANLIALFENPTNRSKGSDSSKFQSRYIIKQSLDAIIVIDTSKKIQDVNKSTIEMLGYSRDQLIGEPIENFISRTEENDQQTTDFFSQLNFINRQAAAAPRYNLQVICSNMNLTPVSCTLLLIASEENIDLQQQQQQQQQQMNDHDQNDEIGDKPAFALVLRDRTAFTEQEKKLQDAKRTVEMLLYRILPRVMANKLLSKNQVLHSKVERATIIFIAIVNFLDWCRLHSHTEIMELLDVIFTKFDQNISKYPTLVKLKIINGVYMAAGGLFNEVSANSHEVEAIQFAIKCGKSVRKRNLLTKSYLQLQIGVNTGGPIIAGILGSDKPLFDIWGDAVNVSARLETSAPFDTVQMSKETKDSLPENTYKLTQREKVFLKGKGDATTYVLDLADPFIEE